MTTVFCVGPAKRNIGNDIISVATSELLHSQFGPGTTLVNIPALQEPEYGGLTASQVYDMNRFADGVLIGGGNLFENGQITVDLQALDALQAPMMLLGLSHGRIYDHAHKLVPRTDSMAPAVARALIKKAAVRMVRDQASQAAIRDIVDDEVELGGCPSMFMQPNPPGMLSDGRVLISIRHPARINVPAQFQWRVVDDLRRLIGQLKKSYANAVTLVCHDYRDIEFAAAFPEVQALYFDDVHHYIRTLRLCRLNISYRLHAFLPCLSFGVPSIHISYDERGKDMVATAGMADWDVDLFQERDIVDTVMARTAALADYYALRSAALPKINQMRDTTMKGLSRFSKMIAERSTKKEI